jgi:hypothetical protein
MIHPMNKSLHKRLSADLPVSTPLQMIVTTQIVVILLMYRHQPNLLLQMKTKSQTAVMLLIYLHQPNLLLQMIAISQTAVTLLNYLHQLNRFLLGTIPRTVL